MEELLVPVFLAGLFVVGARVARGQGWVKTRAGCERCGRQVPAAEVRFFRNTGMIIMFRTESDAGRMCRSCGLSACARATGWTLVLGWWGLISFFINWAFLANNFGNLLVVLGLPGALTVRASALEEHREYARNLLATKDLATVVQVLVKQTGAPEETVLAFLATVPRE